MVGAQPAPHRCLLSNGAGAAGQGESHLWRGLGMDTAGKRSPSTFTPRLFPAGDAGAGGEL